jgi:hypothetical protein
MDQPHLAAVSLCIDRRCHPKKDCWQAMNARAGAHCLEVSQQKGTLCLENDLEPAALGRPFGFSVLP